MSIWLEVDYKPLCTDYKDLYEQFSTLKKSKTLEYFSYLSRCSGGYGLAHPIYLGGSFLIL